MADLDTIALATAAVGLTVLTVEPVDSGRIFALVSAEIEIEGVTVIVHGIQAVRDPEGTRIELPKYRDHAGTWRSAVTLPEEIKRPLGDAALEVLLERGIARRRVG